MNCENGGTNEIPVIPIVNGTDCRGAKESCENKNPGEGDDLCCLWKLPKSVNVLGDPFWLKEDENLKDDYYQACASIDNLQYQTRSAYGARKSRENGLDQNIIIECKSSNTQKLPAESEPCRKTTDTYSSAPSKNTCGPKTVEGEKGDSMCCYWKPTGKSNINGFLDKDECAAINDDQYCNLNYYEEKKKKQYGLDSLEIVCPGQKDDYCSKNYCFDSTEVGGDGSYYCDKRPIHKKKQDEGDKYCSMWNPEKGITSKDDYAWLSGKTKCASINEEQKNDLANYIKTKQQDSGISNLQIVTNEQVSKCSDITDTTKCKYSLENDEGDELCCKWSVPVDTESTKGFWLLDEKYKVGSNYEHCASMSIKNYQDLEMM